MKRNIVTASITQKEFRSLIEQERERIIKKWIAEGKELPEEVKKEIRNRK